MKPMTIWQRLDRALLLLILLLFVAVGLAFWVAMEHSNANLRRDQLSRDRYQVSYDIMLMIDALRVIATDPKNDLERKRYHDTENELDTKLAEMQRDFKEFPDLLTAIKNLSDFTRGNGPGTLNTFQNKVTSIAESDVAGALSFITANYPPLERRRHELFQDLATQVEQVHTAESMRALTVALVGGTCIILVALIAYFVGRQQSSAIAEPLNRLVSNLDRMRRGDFSERLSLDQKDEFGVVGQGLNRLADDLCELVGQVQRSGIQVNTTATQISATQFVTTSQSR